jgi:hypothetical protein
VFIYVASNNETRAQVFKVRFKYLVPAFSASAPRTFPDHRWTGADDTFRAIGIPSCVHGFFDEVYLEYLASYHQDAFAASALRDMRLAAGQDVVRDVGDVPIAAVPGEAIVLYDAAHPMHAALPAANSYAEENRQHRGKARRFFESAPGTRLVLFMAVYLPAMRL